MSLAWQSVTKTLRISGYSRQIGLYQGERIATPACALARNDRFFDSLRNTPTEVGVFLPETEVFLEKSLDISCIFRYNTPVCVCR